MTEVLFARLGDVDATSAQAATIAAQAAQAAAEAAAAIIPVPGIGDAGKFVTVNMTEDGYTLAGVAPGAGDMLAATYDPTGVADDAFARGNHTGTQLLATISDAGNLAEWATLNPSANAGSLVTAATYAAMRALLDLEAGTDFYSVAGANAAFAAAVHTHTVAQLSDASANGRSLISAATYAAMRGLLDLEAGTDFYSIAAADTAFLTPAEGNAAYQPLDADLTVWAGVTSSANGRSLVSSATYATMRGLLDLEAGTDFYSIAAANAAFQPLDTDLTAIAGLTATTDNVVQSVGSAWASRTPAQLTATLPVVVGDAGAGGAKGLVPATVAGDAVRFLRGDATWQSIPGGGDALVANPLSQFAATTSLQLLGVMSDETGTGALVFANTPTLVTPNIGAATGTSLTLGGNAVLTTATGQPLDADLTSIAALTTTAFGRGFLDLANAAASRTYVGMSANGSSLVSAANYAAMRTLLGLVVGTDVQAFDADLTTWAGITPSANVQSMVSAANYAAVVALLEPSIETAIDTLGNLTSIQGHTVTLADAGADALLGWDDSASAYQNLSGSDARAALGLVIGTNVREVLTANRTYFVRTDGSDSNTGLVDSAGGAFLTIANAITTAAALDLSIFSVTIDVGNGTYTGANPLKTYVGGGSITIVGDETTPANVVISTTSANCFTATSVSGRWHLRGMRLQTTTSGRCIESSYGSSIIFQNIDFGAANSAHMIAYNGGLIETSGNYSISGGAARHIWIETQGCVNTAARTVTLTGTPNFSTVYLQDTMLSFYQANGMTFVGSATGKRYTVESNSVSFGAGTLPGDVAGTTATGGIYI